VRIPPYFSDCVAFLMETGHDPSGTGFFVEVEENSRNWIYFITALHSIESAYGRSITIRLNTHRGVPTPPLPGYEEHDTDKNEWFKHDKADIAAILIDLDRSRYSFECVPLYVFIDSQSRIDLARFREAANPGQAAVTPPPSEIIEVQLGDEVFAPGLFVQSAGANRNLPVVRFGNIARMPGEELIALETKRQNSLIRAYLVDAHSWGGLSGAPMFWHFKYDISTAIVAERVPDKPKSPLDVITQSNRKEHVDVLARTGNLTGLLGVVSGHYNILTKSTDETIATALNAGIVIVTPAENIRELLMRDDVCADRKRCAAR